MNHLLLLAVGVDEYDGKHYMSVNMKCVVMWEFVFHVLDEPSSAVN